MDELRRYSQKNSISHRSYNENASRFYFIFISFCFGLIVWFIHKGCQAGQLCQVPEAVWRLICGVQRGLFPHSTCHLSFLASIWTKILQPSCFTFRLTEHLPCLLQDCLQRSVRQLGDHRAVSSMVAVKWAAAGSAGSSHHLVLPNHSHRNQGYLQGKGLSLFLFMFKASFRPSSVYLFNL